MSKRRTSILNNKEKLLEVTKKHHTIRNCLVELGLRAAGGNYKSFKASCKRFNISLPDHKKDPNFRARKIHRYSLDEILVENSAYKSRAVLKKRLLENNMLENKCYICNLLPIWNNQSLTLQLDHINGIFNDNRIKNLRLLCPNCHSQTKNFAGRNSKNKMDDARRIALLSPLSKSGILLLDDTSLYCNCGKTKNRYSKVCKHCHNKNRIKKFEVSKEELNKLLNIDKIPFTQIGKMFGVSDNAIRKRAKSLGIM